MTPEIGELLDKARDCLVRARIILAAGAGEDAGRDAYLAGFHAAQAVIRARTGRTAKTHRGVHRMLPITRQVICPCGMSARAIIKCSDDLPRVVDIRSERGFRAGRVELGEAASGVEAS